MSGDERCTFAFTRKQKYVNKLTSNVSAPTKRANCSSVSLPPEGLAWI